MTINDFIQKIKNNENINSIIEERLNYLRSEKYQKNKEHYISNSSKLDTGALIKWQGFIPEDFKIDSLGVVGMYFTSESTIYEYVTQLIKDNIAKDEKEIKGKILCSGRSYFLDNPNFNPEYKELVDMMKNENYSKTDIREEFRMYIAGYKHYKDHFKNFEEFYDYSNYIESLRGKERTPDEDLAFKNFLHNGPTRYIISLNDLQGLGIPPAMCSEIATCTQNILAFFGYDIYMVAGYYCENGRSEPHNFNLLHANNGIWLIVDNATETYHKIPLEENFNIDDFIAGKIDIAIPDYDVTYKSYDTKAVNLNNTEQEAPHRKL